MVSFIINFIRYIFYFILTEVAGEGGPDLAYQKFLLSQKFRHLMKCKKYLEIFFYLALGLKLSFSVVMWMLQHCYNTEKSTSKYSLVFIVINEFQTK